MSKRNVIRLLNWAGYELRKKGSVMEIRDAGELSQTSDLIVEFIGAYGVGKSTLFRSVWPQHEHEWYSRKQLRRHAEHHRFEVFNLPDTRFIHYYEKLLVLKFRNLFQSDWPMSNKVELYDFFKIELGLDMYFSFNKLTRGLFSDDGILHNFAAELLEMMQDATDALELDAFLAHLFNKRALIYLKADPKIIEERLKKRSAKAPGACNDWITYWQTNCVSENVAGCIDLVVDRIDRIISAAEKRGSAILRLDEEKGMERNGNEICGFLEELKTAEED